MEDYKELIAKIEHTASRLVVLIEQDDEVTPTDLKQYLDSLVRKLVDCYHGTEDQAAKEEIREFMGKLQSHFEEVIGVLEGQLQDTRAELLKYKKGIKGLKQYRSIRRN